MSKAKRKSSPKKIHPSDNLRTEYVLKPQPVFSGSLCWRLIYKGRRVTKSPCKFLRRPGFLTCKGHHSDEDIARTYATREQLDFLRQELLDMDGVVIKNRCIVCPEHGPQTKIEYHYSVVQRDDVVYSTIAVYWPCCDDCTVFTQTQTDYKTSDTFAEKYRPKKKLRRTGRRAVENSRKPAQHQEEPKVS